MNRNTKPRGLRPVAIPVLLLALISNGSRADVAAQAFPKSKVVTIRSPKAVDGRNRCDAAEVKAMLEQGLRTLTGAAGARQAWVTLGLTAEDVVGIKLNCNNWTIKLSPHPEFVAALSESLSSVVPLNNIVFSHISQIEIINRYNIS